MFCTGQKLNDVSIYDWDLHSRTIRKKSKKSKIVRKPVLPADILVDVLNCINRITLDKRCQLLSRRMCASAKKAQPLRPVEEVHFEYDAEKHHFSIVLKFLRVWGDARMANKVKSRDFACYSDAMDHFFNGLRWSYVLRDIRLHHLEIGADFVGRMTNAGKDCVVQGHRLFVKDITFKDDFSPMGFLRSLPKAQALNRSTRSLLETTGSTGGEILKTAASNSIWHVCPSENSDKAITEADIFDFLFGAYQNGDCERKLGLKEPSISAKFLESLWQAAHKCQLKHMAYLKIESTMQFDTNQISEFVRADVRRYQSGWDSKHSLYDFPDMPRFRIVQWHRQLSEIVCWFNFDEEDMDCDGSLR
ncbi:hypothetical protein AAVH_16105 [Aphelenchoides avenae]|nr:hypothetical protein AAVH_16105 [Aphelenchus avenae]